MTVPYTNGASTERGTSLLRHRWQRLAWWLESVVTEVMACRMLPLTCLRQTGHICVRSLATTLGAKPLPEPMLTYSQLKPLENVSVKLLSKFKYFHLMDVHLKIWSVKMAAILSMSNPHPHPPNPHRIRRTLEVCLIYGMMSVLRVAKLLMSFNVCSTATLIDRKTLMKRCKIYL